VLFCFATQVEQEPITGLVNPRSTSNLPPSRIGKLLGIFMIASKSALSSRSSSSIKSFISDQCSLVGRGARA
jgi:hypothetical protein